MLIIRRGTGNLRVCGFWKGGWAGLGCSLPEKQRASLARLP